MSDDDGPLRCVRCAQVILGGEGQPSLYWCPARVPRVAAAPTQALSLLGRAGAEGETLDSEALGGDTIESDSLDGEERELVEVGPVGARFPGYHLRGELGRGGSGVVYRAWSEEHQREVALKVLAAGAWASDQQKARFEREVRTLAGLDHPGVVGIVGSGDGAAGPWYAMEIVEGPPLSAVLIERGGLPPELACSLLESLATTLAAIHQRGLVHRDIKPGNILMTIRGRPLLSDFGLAFAEATPEQITRTAQLVGTPRYMAPEQLACAVEDWPRVDVFALGIVLLETLGITHRREVDGSLSLTSGSHGAPPPLLWIAERATARDPADRYPSAAAFAKDLASWRTRTFGGGWSRLLRAGPRRSRLGRRLFTAGGLLLGILLTVGAVLLGQALLRERHERDLVRVWEATLADIDELRASGREAEAQQRFEGFTTAPEMQGTRALGHAWLWRADDLAAREGVSASLGALGSAASSSDDREVRHLALVRLADGLQETRRYRELRFLLERLPALAPRLTLPADPERELIVALAGAELLEAADLVSGRPAAIFRALAQAEPLEEHRGADGSSLPALPRSHRELFYDFDGDGIDEGVFSSWEELAWSGPAAERLEMASCDRLRAVEDGVLAGCLREGQTSLQHIGVDGWTERFHEPGGSVLGIAEVDGRSFLATADPYRALLELLPTGDVSAHPPTDRLGSYSMQMASGDLTGDGRSELVVGMGAPVGFSLRVFAVPADGSPLVLLAERLVGVPDAVEIVQTRAGPRLLVSTTRNHPSREMFPVGDPHGGPARIEVLELRDGVLHVERSDTFAEEEYDEVGLILPVDIDGDGILEVMAGLELGWGEHGTLLYIQDEAGRLGSPLVLEGYRALAAGERDGTPGAEILVIEADERAWIVGAGDGVLPALTGPGAEEMSGDWGWLEALGQLSQARAAWEREAASARTVPQRQQALREVARLAWEMNDLRGAIEAMVRAARSTTPPTLSDLQRAHELSIEAVEFADARALGEELEQLCEGCGGPLAGWLARVDVGAVSLDLASPLPGWVQRSDPLTVRHSLASERLSLDIPRCAGPVLRLPLQRTDAPLALEVVLEVERTELGAGVEFLLEGAAVGTDDPRIFDLWGYGGGGFSRRRVRQADGRQISRTIDQVDDTEQIHLRLLELPGDRVQARIDTAGESRTSVVPIVDGADLQALTIRAPEPAQEERLCGQVLSIELERLRLGGVAVDEEAPPLPEDPWLTWASAGGPLPEGELPAAGRQLLVGALRLDSGLLARLAEELGEAQASRLFAEAWWGNSVMSRRQPSVRRELIDLPDLVGVEAGNMVPLLLASGQARWLEGDLQRARETLQRASSLVASADSEVGWRAAFAVEATLAEMALLEGGGEDAVRHLRRAMAYAPTSLVGHQLIQGYRHPDGPDGWALLLAEAPPEP